MTRVNSSKMLIGTCLFVFVGAIVPSSAAASPPSAASRLEAPGASVSAEETSRPPTRAAAKLTLDLVENSFDTGYDKGPVRYLYAEGEVFRNGKLCGYYMMEFKIVFGTVDALNTAAITINLFEAGGDPPENLTLQGSHSFDTGDQKGGVSGASRKYRRTMGNRYTLSNDGRGHGGTLVIRK